MPRLYQDIAQAVKEALFEVIIPESYRPHVSELYTGENAPPMINNPNPYERCVARYPITYIVDMFYNKVDFSIVHRKDAIEIVRLLEIYLKQYEGLQTTDEATTLFITRARATYDAMSARQRTRKRDEGTYEPQIGLLDALGALNGGKI
jgi:hypothetical protein